MPESARSLSEVQKEIPKGNGGNNNVDVRLRDVENRLTAIEGEIRHLATGENIAELKTLIAEKSGEIQQSFSDKQANTLKWLIGVSVASATILIVAVIRTLM